MEYLARVNGQTFEIKIEKEGRIKVGDQLLSVDMQTIDGHALHSLLIDHESYELDVYGHGDSFRVLLGGEIHEVKVENDQPHRARRKKRACSASPSDAECIVRAPLPGLVIQVLVSAGQEVSIGEVSVILESMKMENEVLTPRRGIVEKIHVVAGDTANQGDPLITIC